MVRETVLNEFHHNSARKLNENNWWVSTLHLVKNRQDHIKSWSFTRILIHANSNQLGKMLWDTRRDGYSQTFQGNLWITKRLYIIFHKYRSNHQKMEVNTLSNLKSSLTPLSLDLAVPKALFYANLLLVNSVVNSCCYLPQTIVWIYKTYGFHSPGIWCCITG